MNCIFCHSIEKREGSVFLDIDLGAFVAKWDNHPSTPGHALVIPKRHIQYLHQLNSTEQATYVGAVIKAQDYISRANLGDIYENALLNGTMHYKNDSYVRSALDQLVQLGNRPPEAFNHGINDGPAAGQTVPHLHWHIMPRWHDSSDPRGGVRHMFEGMGRY